MALERAKELNFFKMVRRMSVNGKIANITDMEFINIRMDVVKGDVGDKGIYEIAGYDLWIYVG